MIALFDLRLEGKLLLLAIDVKLDLSSSDIDVGVCCAQERPAQDEWRLGVDFHVEHDEVDMNKEISLEYSMLFPRDSGPFDPLAANTWQ